MSDSLILAMAFLTAIVANITDWAVTRRGAFWWSPSGRMWIACLAAISATAFASLQGWIPPSVLPMVVMPTYTFQQLGSIWVRHASPAPVA